MLCSTSRALEFDPVDHRDVGFFLLPSTMQQLQHASTQQNFTQKNSTWTNEDYQPHVGLFSSYPYSKLLVTKHVLT